MLKLLLSLALILFLLSNISASCNETQVDINTANLTELDKIKWVGLATAEKIVQLRPFSSLDELVNVSGISEGRLEDIKIQGLACVSEDSEQQAQQQTQEEETPTATTENETTEESSDSSNSEEEEIEEETGRAESLASSANKATTNAITLETIDLNSKDIKSDDNKETLKNNLALGGVISFCVLFGGLFFLKSIQRKKENEFR